MSSFIDSDPTVRALQFSLDGLAKRAQVATNDIANADTPNYKARDIDFNTSLAAALGETGAGALMLAQSAPGHLKAAGANRYGAAVKYRREYQASVDGNTVNMDVERAAFAENAIHMEAVLSFIHTDFKDLSAALQP